MRLFVAVNLPADDRQRLFDATAGLRAGSYPFRWALPEAVHLTLEFLGSVAEPAVPAIREVLAAVAGRHATFELGIGGVDAFPDLRRPRVIWVGADGGTTLLELQADLVESMEPLGFEPEKRKWSPHITIGRARPNARRTDFTGLGAVAGAIDYEATVPVESVDLMRSHLGPGGARYERVQQAALRQAAPTETGERESIE